MVAHIGGVGRSDERVAADPQSLDASASATASAALSASTPPRRTSTRVCRRRRVRRPLPLVNSGSRRYESGADGFPHESHPRERIREVPFMPAQQLLHDVVDVVGAVGSGERVASTTRHPIEAFCERGPRPCPGIHALNHGASPVRAAPRC